MTESNESHDLVSHDSSEDDVETLALLSTLLPVFGGFISNMLNGVVAGRRRKRMLETLSGIVQWMESLDAQFSQAAKEYIKTEDFEELLTETLERVSREHNAERRSLYGLFLKGSIACPNEPYDEQLRFLKTMDELQWAHVIILRAYLQEPNSPTSVISGSIRQTLITRIGDQLDGDLLGELVAQLHGLGIVEDASIGTVMTGSAAEDLRSRFKPYGRRFIDFLETGAAQ